MKIFINACKSKRPDPPATRKVLIPVLRRVRTDTWERSATLEIRILEPCCPCYARHILQQARQVMFQNAYTMYQCFSTIGPRPGTGLGINHTGPSTYRRFSRAAVAAIAPANRCVTVASRIVPMLVQRLSLRMTSGITS
jgi:hypothetical protein